MVSRLGRWEAGVAKKQNHRPRFRVGDWAVWVAGNSRHVVRIIEDMGLVGVGQRRYYRFREQIPYGEMVESGMPEDLLEPATPEDIAEEAKYLKS
jgi:hypothetical protein